jgi:hypothetical protein
MKNIFKLLATAMAMPASIASGAMAAAAPLPAAIAPPVLDANADANANAGSNAGEKIGPGMTYRRIDRSGEHRFVAHIVDVDLATPGLAFVVTPGDRSRGMEYVAMRTSRFLILRQALLAINASYFLPFSGGSPGGDDYYPHDGDPANASGAVIADGAVVSPVETDLDLRINAMLCFDGLKVLIADGQTCPAGFPGGVAAGPRLLAEGVRRSFTANENHQGLTPHPRTAIGIAKDRSRAWIVVVDGRQKGYSDGANLITLTDLFVELGAVDAINLDGGGSSTLVRASPDGSAQVLNRPIHVGVPGRERPVANHIAIISAVPAK